MKRYGLAATVALLLLGSATTHAQEAPLPADAMSKLINAPAADQWTIFGSNESHKMVRDDTVPGGYAYTISVAQAGANPWDVQAAITVPKPVHKGDVLLFAFWGRALALPQSTGTAHINGRLQEAHAPYAAIGEQSLDLRGDWKLYYVSGVAQRDFAAGETTAGLHLASAAQTVALGPVFVLDFGPDYDTAKLPKN